MLRKDYLVKTVTPAEAVGMYLAKPVIKSWKEDFVDEDTQEIISIERNEILFHRDKRVDSRMAKDIAEYGITEVHVTNIPGRATELRDFYRLAHVKVTMRSPDHHGVVICRAESVRKGIDLATDYTEGATEEVFGCHADSFHITDVELLSDITFIGRTAADIEAERKALEKDRDTPIKTPFKVQATYANAELWHEGENNKEAWTKKRKFVAWGHDIKEVRDIVRGWIKKDIDTMIGRDEKRDSLVVGSAVPFTEHVYLPASVCNEYITNDSLRLATEDAPQ